MDMIGVVGVYVGQFIENSCAYCTSLFIDDRTINPYRPKETRANSIRTATTIVSLLCSRNDQQYALICTTPLFHILAATCFGSSLPSSGSFVDPSELLEIQIEWVVYHIMCGYVACVPDCRGSILKYKSNEWYIK
jgi:hypothetical protein